MLRKLHLFWLEQRLRLRLGKYNAYLNRICDADAQHNVMRRLTIAKRLLAEPELELGQRMLEAARVKNRSASIPITERGTAFSKKRSLSGDLRPRQTG
jgi:hypothetical protein